VQRQFRFSYFTPRYEATLSFDRNGLTTYLFSELPSPGVP
jgi:hypothetical protein